MSLEQKINHAWYQDQKWIRALWPLSKLYEIGLNRRRQKALSENRSLPVPVVVVGNITLGGTGKTPLIIYLSQKLEEQGLSVGVISRGYIARSSRITKNSKSDRNIQYPYQVSSNDVAEKVGDEPLMICQSSNAVVVIDPDRYAAAQYLLRIKNVDVILSDDGMQHFGLPRDLEILVVDGSRELGNERLLPSGPLREPLERLRTVDFCLINRAGVHSELKSEALKYVANGDFELNPQTWVQVSTGRRLSLNEFTANELLSAEAIKAVAGIGNPQRFLNTLKGLGIESEFYPLDDHQVVGPELLASLVSPEKPETKLLMTMKDAVKCKTYAPDNCWALDVGLQMEASLESQLLTAIQALTKRTNRV